MLTAVCTSNRDWSIILRGGNKRVGGNGGYYFLIHGKAKKKK